MTENPSDKSPTYITTNRNKKKTTSVNRRRSEVTILKPVAPTHYPDVDQRPNLLDMAVSKNFRWPMEIHAAQNGLSDHNTVIIISRQSR